MSTGPKSGWGGARPGAGRKKETLSATQVKEMLLAAKAYAAKTGKTIDQILLDIIYSLSEGTRDRLAAIKLWKEYTIAKLQEGGETDEALGPQIFLPEVLPDPGEVVPFERKANSA